METTDTSKFLPVAVIVAGILIAGAVLWNGSRPAGQAGAGQQGDEPPAAQAEVKDLKTAGDPYIGKADAPLTIAFWSDYQCPFCKQFEVNTLPQIITDYVATGKVKIVVMDFAFLGPDSLVGAEYGRAVWQLYPDKYMDWRTAIYATQPTENTLNDADYLAWIKKTTESVAGIDAAKVTAAVAANKAAYDAAIASDKAEGQKAGVNATPAFVIGKQLILGAYPYANFKAALDQVVK